MIVKNSIALMGAGIAGITPSLLFIGALGFSPFSGAAAITSLLALPGSMISGLLALTLLSVGLALFTFFMLQLTLIFVWI